jgi:hypothetical protein
VRVVIKMGCRKNRVYTRGACARPQVHNLMMAMGARRTKAAARVVEKNRFRHS